MKIQKTKNSHRSRGFISPTVAVVIVLLVAMGIAVYAFGKRSNSSSSSMRSSAGPAPSSAQSMQANKTAQPDLMQESPQTSMGNKENTKTFNISSKPFEFSVKEIRVKKGDAVKIVLVNEQGFHDWVIDEFSARTKQLNAGETDSVEFVADKAGTFEYYCSVGNHRQMGMVGKLIVE